MRNGTVIAELTGQGRGGLDPAGAGVRVGAGRWRLRWCGARQWFASVRPGLRWVAGCAPTGL